MKTKITIAFVKNEIKFKLVLNATHKMYLKKYLQLDKLMCKFIYIIHKKVFTFSFIRILAMSSK